MQATLQTQIIIENSILQLFRLYAEEGIFLGASSALNLVAAMKVAETMPKGNERTVV